MASAKVNAAVTGPSGWHLNLTSRRLSTLTPSAKDSALAATCCLPKGHLPPLTQPHVSSSFPETWGFLISKLTPLNNLLCKLPTGI